MLQKRRRHIEKRVQSRAVAAGGPQVAAVFPRTDPPVELVPQQSRTQVHRSTGRRRRRHDLLLRRSRRRRVVGRQPAVLADVSEPTARIEERLCPARAISVAENAADRRRLCRLGRRWCARTRRRRR